jgi:predicted nucleic acid-binding protein
LSDIAIVDSGPLYAAADESDESHDVVLAVLLRPDLHLVIPALAITEVSYLIAKRLGPHAEAAFLRGIRALDVECPTPDDWTRIAELAERYADFPLGAVDASVVALAERLGTDLLITLDRRHFAAVRPKHCSFLRLLPE